MPRICIAEESEMLTIRRAQTTITLQVDFQTLSNSPIQSSVSQIATHFLMEEDASGDGYVMANHVAQSLTNSRPA
jgi:hypothetical protein